MEIKRILCGVDFSSVSPKVAHYAISFAAKFQAKVYYLYVSPTMTQYIGMHIPQVTVNDFAQELERNASKMMEDFADRHKDGQEAEGLVKSGYPVEEILKVADTKQADLIIIGTHGRKGIDKMVFGSVAEKVIKSAKIPVLTVSP